MTGPPDGDYFAGIKLPGWRALWATSVCPHHRFREVCMYKSEDEKLSDKMMGEAVMVLLRQDAAISNSALMRQLRDMVTVETDPRRQVALMRAIDEVSQYLSVKPPANRIEIRDRDNVTHFFTSEGPANGVKKH
ncbi:hypothetical protein ETA_19190 [Erwinia tasmaniensis Et1/99]|uniref:Uncharacterized protein n=2 Tax=Erwinia tasmaniensis TaxID=338565 RepID=B2VID9_ERWT9|nr:hypothetical protein ETA_19190 [Erwinia tasmaniensis Et1/99]